MKKLLFISAIASMALFSSCSDEDEVTAQDIVEEMDIDAEESLESSFEDVDLIVEAGMQSVETGGRIDQDDLLDCAVVTRDTVNNTVTIDYGDGCEGPGGRTRAGKILISYNDHRLVPGAYREVTFENFSIDGVKIEGSRRIENISESLDDNPTFRVTLTGGKLTFEDGTVATRESVRTRTWVRASNPLNDESYIEGNASGSRRDGSTYSMEIIERIVFKRACWARGVFVPVSGIKQFTSGDNVVILDYGDGECDYVATVSVNGGEPFEINLKPRGRFK